MENAAKLIAIPLLSLFLAACGGDESPKQTSAAAGPKVDKVLLVSETTLNDQPALSLALGGTGENYFDVTLYRSNTHAGYVGSSTSASNPSLNATANWDGKYYVQSSKHPTEVLLKFTSVTPSEAVIEFSAKLVNPSSGELLDLKNSVVKVEGEALQTITAQ